MKTISRTGLSSNPHPTGGAFTLLELILVMVLMCAVLGMVATSLRGFFASHQTADAAGQIVALAQFALTQAVSEGRNYRLNLDTQAGTYWLTAQDGATYVNVPTEFGRTFTLPEGTAFDSAASTNGQERVVFTPRGTSASARIRLMGRQGECVDIGCLAPAEPFCVLPAAEEAEP